VEPFDGDVGEQVPEAGTEVGSVEGLLSS